MEGGMMMADREKVIKGLEQCLAVSKKGIRLCSDCPYCEYDSKDDMDCWDWLATHALELLKEQEAVVQKTGHWIWLQFCANEGVYCSECHTKMFDRYPMKKKFSQFCGHCGAKMDDEVEGR